MTETIRERDSEPRQYSHTVGHQALAASLIDRRRGAIEDNNTQAFLSERNRSGKTGRSSTDDADVSLIGNRHSTPSPVQALRHGGRSHPQSIER